MKISHKKSLSKKQKILITVGAILLVGGGTAIFYFLNTQRNSTAATNTPRPVNSVDYNPPTKQEEESTSEQKDQIIKGQPTGDQPASNDIVVTISRANQTSAGLSIGTVIDGLKGGSCDVSLTRTDQATVQKTFTISYDVASAMCQEAIIPIEEIPAGGEWQLIVTATDGNKTSKPATQTVTIDKP